MIYWYFLKVLSTVLMVTTSVILIDAVGISKIKSRKDFIISLSITAAMSIVENLLNVYYSTRILFVFYLLAFFFAFLICFKKIKAVHIYIAILSDMAESLFSSCFALLSIRFIAHDYDSANLISMTIVRIVFLVCSIVLYRRNYLRSLYGTARSIPLHIWLLSLLGIVCMTILSEFNNFPIDSTVKQNSITILISVLTVTLIIMVCSLLINVSAKIRIDSVNHVFKKQIEMQIAHYEKLERLNNDIRKFRHDYINHLNSISALIDAKCYEDAKDYIQKLTLSNHSSNVMFHTGNRLADAILSDKSDTCRDFAAIEFNGYISDKIDNADICTIFANALDNAIEACEKCSEKGTISIAAQERQGYQAISMRNPTVSGDTVGKMKTTKEDIRNHGLGLLSMEQAIKRYDGNMETKIENGFFELSITMKL